MYCVNSHYSSLNTSLVSSGLLVPEGIIIPVVSARGYHHPGSQCFGTDMVYEIYILLKFTVPI